MLILGGGYVGSRFAKLLQSQHQQVAVFSRQEKPATLLWQGEISKNLIDQGYDTLLMAVAPDTSADYESTYLATAKLLINSPLKHLIYTSSTSVYGEHQGATVTETTPLATSLSAVRTQTQILIATEKTLLNSDKKITCLRLGEIIGPGRDLQERLAKVTKPLAGTGSALTNIIHIEDILGALMHVYKHQLLGIYNLVSDLHITRKKLYQLLAPHLTWDPSQKPLHGGNKRVSNEKIKRSGYTFHHSMPFAEHLALVN